jgi:hypothetical protein
MFRALSLMFVMLVGCSSTVARVQRAEAPRAKARWVILPFSNHSETPQAGERIEAMLGTVLRVRGVPSLDAYAALREEESRLSMGDRQRLDESIAWAKNQRFDYAVTGSVEEWRYKTGIDGEPAIGVSVRIVEVGTNRVVWSASGSKTGGGGDNTSGTALKLLDTLVSELDLAQ